MQLRPPIPYRGLSVLALLAGCAPGPDSLQASPQERKPVPVAVAPVERGPLTHRRTVNGSLEAAAEFVVTPKVGGTILSLEVELGDPVERGQVVARMDDDELQQAVQQAEADLAVAKASRIEAESVLEISKRAVKRLTKLREEAVISESELDVGLAEEVASRARLEVASASVQRAESSLEAARIRLGYAAVPADWGGDDRFRVVGERFVDEGGNVPPNTPLLSVVQLDPIVAVVFVAERDYRLLSLGQRAELTTDAHPDRTFEGSVRRIAPVFRSSTRQARVELELANPDGLLKPGMYVRATLDLDHVDEATVVPHDALTEREGATGVFVLEAGEQVRWRPVSVGIRDGTFTQVLDEELAGDVVVLGQELCDDGARVHVVETDTRLSR